MNEWIYAIFTCAGILLVYSAWGLAMEARAAREGFQLYADSLSPNHLEPEPMQNVTFRLYRRLSQNEPGVILDNRVDGAHGRRPAIVSTMELEVLTDNPFAARSAIQADYPGWAVGSDWVTATDREFDDTFADSYPEELDSGDE